MLAMMLIMASSSGEAAAADSVALDSTRSSVEMLWSQAGQVTNLSDGTKVRVHPRQLGHTRLMAFSETYTRQHNTNNIIKLSLLINDMEKERAVEERRQLEQQHLIEQKHNKAITYTYILIILIILAIVALIYSRYRYERKNRELQRAQADQELNYKNEIIKIQRLQQYQERNSMEALSEELNRTANITDNKEMRTELRRVIRQLQQRGMDNDWADVEKTLASANDTLYANLLKEYPNLTKNERKLCTLIHMKLSTKEIANITHQSTGSINVARSRLRQKFGLTDSDISLISFLDKFKG